MYFLCTGNLTEFNASSEDWNSNIERLKLFCEANSREREKQQLILLSTVGGETYKIFKGLTSPVKPKDRSLSKIS